MAEIIEFPSPPEFLERKNSVPSPEAMFQIFEEELRARDQLLIRIHTELSNPAPRVDGYAGLVQEIAEFYTKRQPSS